MTRFRLIALVCAVLVLSACGNTGAKIGSTVKGERLAVLKPEKALEVDKELQGQKPQLPPPATNDVWPQAGFDPSHVLPDGAISAQPEDAWSSSIGDGSDSDYKLLSRPVMNSGRIFTMDARGLVRAFDVKDGDEVWSFDTTPEDSDQNTIGGGIGADSGTVYATTGFGEVVALEAADGKVKWRRSLQNPLRAAPTIADNRVYAVSIDNQLSVLNARTGDIIWQHNGIAESATLMGASNPAVVGDSVVVAYSSGEIYNLRAENGRVSWNYALTSPTQVGALPAIADIRGLPVIDHGRVFAISHSGRMASIDQRTGDRAWEVDIGGINTPVVAGDAVYVLSNDSQIAAIARDSGRVLWVHELPKLSDPDDHDSDPIFWVGPVAAGGRLWLGNSEGKLVSYSPEDGTEHDTIELDAPIYITPIVAGNTIYVVTNDGHLVALR